MSHRKFERESAAAVVPPRAAHIRRHPSPAFFHGPWNSRADSAPGGASAGRAGSSPAGGGAAPCASSLHCVDARSLHPCRALFFCVQTRAAAPWASAPGSAAAAERAR